jgi:hypothetical protein
MTGFPELLGRLVDALNDANVPFMIAGSFASTAHGLPRATQDLGIVIDPPAPGARSSPASRRMSTTSTSTLRATRFVAARCST